MNKMFEKRKKTISSAGRRKIAIEPLEERILLSVDLIPYAPDDRDEDNVFYERQVEPVQPEVEEYVGLNVFDHKTGCTLHIPRDRQVAKKLIADSKRNTYGSHLNKQFDSK